MKRCIECKKPIDHSFEFCNDDCLAKHIGDLPNHAT